MLAPVRHGKNVRPTPGAYWLPSYQHEDIIDAKRTANLKAYYATKPTFPLCVDGHETHTRRAKGRKEEAQSHSIGTRVSDAPPQQPLFARKKPQPGAEGFFIGCGTINSARRPHAVPPLSMAANTPRM
jgi:hypothetical protein